MTALQNWRGIRDRNEMLAPTDMWKAQGAPENREPFNWARKEGAPFIEAVAVAHNLTDGQVMTIKRGKGGSTFAHWQIGLASGFAAAEYQAVEAGLIDDGGFLGAAKGVGRNDPFSPSSSRAAASRELAISSTRHTSAGTNHSCVP